MRFQRSTLLVLASAIVAVGAAWFTMSGARDGRTPGGDSDRDAVRDEPSPAHAADRGGIPLPKTVRSSLDAAPAPRESAESMASKVDHWSRSSDPIDAMRAYRAVARCLYARRDERWPAEEVALEKKRLEEALPEDRRESFRRSFQSATDACGDLRSDQVQDRLQWLGRAAQAGVPMAALEFIHEGPDGDGLLQDPTVPAPVATQAWMDQRDAYIEVALRHCDISLVGFLGMNAGGDSADVTQALNFWQARTQCGDGAHPPSVMDDPVARRYLRDLNLSRIRGRIAGG